MTKPILLTMLMVACIACCTRAKDETGYSLSQMSALHRIEELSAGLKQSEYYKNISPDTFVAQLTERVKHPYALDQGRTYFCWAAAPIAYLFDKAPKSMAEAVFGMYTDGVFRFNNRATSLCFKLPKTSITAAGSATFSTDSDALAGRVVDQMVLLAFADNYKCWINIDRHFDPGDQTKSIWAGATLNKEKRIWKDFFEDVKKRGHDIFWLKRNKASLVSQYMQTHKLVVLYVNSACFNKKWDRLRTIKSKPPYIITGSHYILLHRIEETPAGYDISFWDDDGMQHTTMSHKLFQRSVFGLTAVMPRGHDTIATIIEHNN